MSSSTTTKASGTRSSPSANTQSVHSQILCSQLTAQLRHQLPRSREGSRDELGQAAEVSKPLPCSIHSAVSKGAAQQGSSLHVEKKRPISVQQQIIGILCNFIPAVEDYQASFFPIVMEQYSRSSGVGDNLK